MDFKTSKNTGFWYWITPHFVTMSSSLLFGDFPKWSLGFRQDGVVAIINHEEDSTTHTLEAGTISDRILGSGAHESRSGLLWKISLAFIFFPRFWPFWRARKFRGFDDKPLGTVFLVSILEWEHQRTNLNFGDLGDFGDLRLASINNINNGSLSPSRCLGGLLSDSGSVMASYQSTMGALAEF